MKVTIKFDPAQEGKFSNIKLCFIENGIERKVPLTFLKYENVFDFNVDFTTLRFDFFLISALVYGVDNLFNREKYSNDGWTRDLEVDFPVHNLSTWQGKEIKLKKILDFLTGDYWTINFIQNSHVEYYFPRQRRRKIPVYDKNSIKSASLFSGGLDSLIGVIDELEKLNPNERILLISHFDYKSSGPNGDQKRLLNYLQRNYPNKFYWVQSKLALSRKDDNDNNIFIENNYRSRSLFFIGLGIYISPINTLIIPENGTISINYPLTPSRVSSLSTRTTHPFVLKNLKELLLEIGLPIQLENPYSFSTKGEMIENCSNPRALQSSFSLSVSCGKRGRKQHWAIKTGTEQCGKCMPCIYRRAALNKINLDNEIFGNDILQQSSLTNDLPALFSYLNRNISLEKMKRDILINGNIDIDNLENYAQMVLRSKDEVLQLFRDKGNNFTKSKLGLL
ncbi:Qat anti-phage system QueC-like protein QatC [Chryseobacterium sp. AG844]|uniref:Qat anti-phage system QueC-like protein QatC n=1 Tax=Chryseobacterium sp. AG844 TaxID=2183998 RepID=UPI000D70EDE2|nr:Qat anti-phage system QueC-like protein QatC [Chryseobacterium sp. AG844]PWW20384.1 hypothetical protein DEU40_11475 [Chryseobacterium sp. AG844]